MNRICKLFAAVLVAVLLLSGCALRTVEDMYRVPRRSEGYHNLHATMDLAMVGLEYAAPLSGENQQTVQTADLDGDGAAEYLLFARGTTGDPLKILVFRQEGESYNLFASIDAQGSAFAQVEYAQIDGKPGVELIVGRQVSDSVLRSVDVYSFASGEALALMAAGYSRLLTCDLDRDSIRELVLVSPGALEDDNAVAVLYRMDAERMVCSTEIGLSSSVDSVKRMDLCRLRGNVTGICVTGNLSGNALTTDLLVWKDGSFCSIFKTDGWQDSDQTVGNDSVYPEDIDGDGILELPMLVPVDTGYNPGEERKYLIRWFSVDSSGVREDELYTFHNYDKGWYLELGTQWAEGLRVEEKGDACFFRVWDEQQDTEETLFSIHTLVSDDREVRALENNRFILYRGQGVIWAARLEASSVSFGINQEYLINHFHVIPRQRHVGET